MEKLFGDFMVGFMRTLVKFLFLYLLMIALVLASGAALLFAFMKAVS